MNTKPTVIIAESDNGLISSIKERLVMCNVEVVGTTTDGAEVIRLIKKFHPNLLILNLILSNKDGVQVLDELNETYSNIDQMDIICTSFFKGPIVDICAKKGASYFVSKPYDINHIADMVMLFSNQPRLPKTPTDDNINTTLLEENAEFIIKDEKVEVLNKESTEADDYIDSRFDYANKSIIVREMLSRSGFNAGNKGFKYLTGSVLMVMAEYTRLERITVTVYPRIATHFNTNKAAVERGIRNLISRCWENQEKRELFDRYFPNSFTSRPSNKDVIELVSRRMNTRYAEYERMCKMGSNPR